MKTGVQGQRNINRYQGSYNSNTPRMDQGLLCFTFLYRRTLIAQEQTFPMYCMDWGQDSWKGNMFWAVAEFGVGVEVERGRYISP